MNDEQKFHDALNQTPDDEHLQQVFADWLEERDDPRVRWYRDPVFARWMKPGEESPYPQLVAALEEESTYEEANRLLHEGGQPAVAALIVALADKAMEIVMGDYYPYDHTQIKPTLKEIASKSKIIAPVATKLRSKNRDQVKAGLQDLQSLGESGIALIADVVDKLEETSFDDDGYQLIVDTFERMGSFAREAVICGWGIQTLPPEFLIPATCRLGPERRFVMVLIRRTLLDTDWEEHPVLAKAALNRMGQSILPDILHTFEHISECDWNVVGDFLSGWAPEIVEPLVTALDTSDSITIRQGIIESLGVIAHNNAFGSDELRQMALDAVTSSIQSKSSRIRNQATENLAYFQFPQRESH